MNNNSMLQKVALVLTITLTIFGILFGMTGLQALPFILAIGLMYFIMFRGKEYNVWLVVLSILMVLMNLAISLIDAAVWALIAMAFWRTNS